MGIEGVHTVSAEKSLEKKRKRSRDMRRKRSNVEMSLFLSFAFPLFCSLWRFPLSSALSFVFLPPRPRTLPPLGVALGLYRGLLHTSRRAALFTNGGAFFVVFFLALNVPRSMLFAVCSPSPCCTRALILHAQKERGRREKREERNRART